MPPVPQISAVLTITGSEWLTKLARGKIKGGIDHFKIGEGGYSMADSIKFPKEPSRLKSRLEAEDNPAQFWYYTKLLTMLDKLDASGYNPLAANPTAIIAVAAREPIGVH